VHAASPADGADSVSTLPLTSASTTSEPVTVTRIGTQVVVRLAGPVDDRQAARLAAAVEEVAVLALERVVVDLDDVVSVEGAGLDFLLALHRRWRVRLLNAPRGLRHLMPRQAV
jgi:ABC-type transporter Mla MlaB component